MDRSKPVNDNWLMAGTSALVSAVVAYFTTLSTLQVRISQLEEREGNHYGEILRRLDAIDRKVS